MLSGVRRAALCLLPLLGGEDVDLSRPAPMAAQWDRIGPLLLGPVG
jgi:hypothetical protein